MSPARETSTPLWDDSHTTSPSSDYRTAAAQPTSGTNFFFNETLQPGISIYNCGWRTDSEIDHISVANQTSNLLVNHGPQTFGTIGPSTLAYTIGVTNGTLGAGTTANQTTSYFLKNTQVTDLSQNNFNVGWEHDINSGTSAGKLTFSIILGWTDRITSNDSVNLNCPASHQTLTTQKAATAHSRSSQHSVFKSASATKANQSLHLFFNLPRTR